MFRKLQLLIYLISLIQQPPSADSSFVLSITEFKTKILRAFENEIRVSFLLIVKCHAINTCSNFKVPMSSNCFFIFPCNPIFHAINFDKKIFYLDKEQFFMSF